MTGEQAREALAAALATGAGAAALVYANRVAVTGGDIAAERRGRLVAVIDSVPGDTLERVYREIQPEAFPARLIAFRLALLANHLGDYRSAAAWLEASAGRDGAFPAAIDPAVAKAVKRDIAARQKVEPDVIVAALPMSGPYAAIGDAIARAIRFAARDDREAGRGASGIAGVRVEFVDTMAGGAVAAIDKAAYVHHAIAILGPVGDKESQTAARRAAEFGIPIALLAPTVAGASPGARVFRLWSSPEWEAREAARLAIALGYDRLAILAPRDEHGDQARQAFTDAARQLGQKIVSHGSYDPTASDLEPDLKDFLGLDPAKNERLRRHLRKSGRKNGWKTFSPDVPFDLLYIPDEYHRAALVASFLPYFNVEVRSRDVMDAIALRRKHRGRIPQVVQLLGSSGWHHESLIPRGGPAVEGALLLDIYSGGENEEYASEDGAAFAQRYEARTGRLPSPVTAQAYDAATLVFAARRRVLLRAQSRRRPGDSVDLRREMARALSTAELDTGACGPARIGASGEIEREAILLRVDGGSFVLHEY